MTRQLSDIPTLLNELGFGDRVTLTLLDEPDTEPCYTVEPKDGAWLCWFCATLYADVAVFQNHDVWDNDLARDLAKTLIGFDFTIRIVPS